MFCDGRNVGELIGYMPKEKLVHSSIVSFSNKCKFIAYKIDV